MNKQIPSYLKLVTDTVNETPTVASEDLAALAEVFQAIEQATQWRLEFAAGPAPDANPSLMWSAPVNPGVGASPGHIRLLSLDDATTGGPSPIAWQKVAAVGEALGKLWGELLATRNALRQREAELASGVPVTIQEDDPSPPLGDRLEGVLKAGAEAVECQAAALYLLDPATTELKLRASWGLPQRRLTDEARPLRGAVADLEALLGHAVVLTDDQLQDYWKVPEEGFASCVCVPVSSPTIPLGTLWAFCTRPREFSDAQTNIIEVVAGRLAADLERPVLVGEALWARDQTRQLAALERSQQDQLPVASPVIAGWEIATRAYHAGPIGGTFYDWFGLEGGGLSLLAGDALAHGLEGAMTAGSLRAAARAFRHYRKRPQLFVERANSILWTTSAGNAGAGLFHAMLDPQADSLVFSSGGPIRVLAVSNDGHTALATATRPLGLDEQQKPPAIRRQFRPRELLLVYGTTFMSDSDELIAAALDQRLALSLEPRMTLPAEQLIEIASEILQTYAARESSDRVLMLIKRCDR